MSNLKPYYKEDQFECGLDEAGAGPLAGPVVAAAVIWDPHLQDQIKEDDEGHYEFMLLKDSKKLTTKQRECVEEFIKYYAIDYSIAFVDQTKIDEINIRNARILAMKNAINQLQAKPEFLLIDGDAWKPFAKDEGEDIPSVLIVNGDNKYQSIAAASILAKCARDRYVVNVMHSSYPDYGWDTNKGYGTKKHYEALKRYGITPYHRKSFNLGICYVKEN